MNKWAYKKIPTYKTRSKINLKTPKVEIPKRNFSLISNPLVLFRIFFKRVAFYLQKDNKTDHLKDKKLLTTTKPQKSVNLTIGNPKLCSH